MCKFILIQGKENAGKTTTCWKIYKDLVKRLPKNDNGQPVEHEFIIPDREITLQTTSVMSVRELNVKVEGNGSSYEERSKESLDFIAILQTESIREIESNRLGIISAGDNYTMMIRAIQTCIDKKVDTIIMSIRSFQNTDERFCGDEYIQPLIEKASNHDVNNIQYVNFAKKNDNENGNGNDKDNDQETEENRIKGKVWDILRGTQK